MSRDAYLRPCAQADHESSHAPEKCVNCRGSHTSFSRSCPAWITEKEVVAVKVIQNNPNFMKPPFVSPTIIDASNEYDKPHKNFGNAMLSVSNILVSHQPSQQLKPITPSTKNAAKTISALKTDKTSASIASVKKKNKKKKNSDKSLKKLKSTDVKHVPPSSQSDGTLSLTTSASGIAKPMALVPQNNQTNKLRLLIFRASIWSLSRLGEF
ncbi:hypothetical protein AVEN_161182-1 [Araneus ventricosus]|uniref:Uncharacterized protein n=1 Tax=Araneus ventricosus TaxID=182803 RepID=A0A4Y2KZA7_ARAVE|nr:hypothetical protein AVEN_161182-1 [Araneus ventricosus]